MTARRPTAQLCATGGHTRITTPACRRSVPIVNDPDRTPDIDLEGDSVSVAGTFVYSSRFGGTWLFETGDVPHIVQAYDLFPTARPGSGDIDELWDTWCARARAVAGRVTCAGEVRTWTTPTDDERDAIIARLAEEGVRARSWVTAVSILTPSAR